MTSDHDEACGCPWPTNCSRGVSPRMSEVQRRRRLYEIVETVSGGHPAFADDPERIEWTNNIVDAIEDVAHGIDRPDIMSRI